MRRRSGSGSSCRSGSSAAGLQGVRPDRRHRVRTPCSVDTPAVWCGFRSSVEEEWRWRDGRSGDRGRETEARRERSLGTGESEGREFGWDRVCCADPRAPRGALQVLWAGTGQG